MQQGARCRKRLISFPNRRSYSGWRETAHTYFWAQGLFCLIFSAVFINVYWMHIVCVELLTVLFSNNKYDMLEKAGTAKTRQVLTQSLQHLWSVMNNSTRCFFANYHILFSFPRGCHKHDSRGDPEGKSTDAEFGTETFPTCSLSQIGPSHSPDPTDTQQQMEICKNLFSYTRYVAYTTSSNIKPSQAKVLWAETCTKQKSTSLGLLAIPVFYLIAGLYNRHLISEWGMCLS